MSKVSMKQPIQDRINIQSRLKSNFPTYYSIIQSEKGAVFISALLTGVLLTFIGISLINVAILQYKRTSTNVYNSNAFLTAEAGIEKSLYELNNDTSFSGFLSEVEFFNTDKQGRGVYTTEIVPGVSNEKILKSTGKIYRSNGELESKRSVRVSLVGTASVTPSVYAGPGGLKLGASARINNSDVYVNGTVSLTGTSSIGSDTKPVNMNVANISCPAGNNPGPSYPSLCTNSQPIKIPDWGSSSIIGTICATGQTQTRFPESQWNTNPPQIRAGSGGGQGLVPGCVAPPVSMPTYDKAEHISRVETISSMSNTNYDCGTWRASDGFKRTWPKNLQLNGNVTIGNSCDLTITGDVYITGNLVISGSASITVDESLGDTIPTIIVNGTVSAGSGGRIIANSSGSAIRIISFASYNNCDPLCTGDNLKKSQNIIGVIINGAGQYPGSIFQAYWSTIKISGSGLVGSALGQMVDMEGAGNITFGTGLSSGTTTWTIRSYQYDFE